MDVVRKIKALSCRLSGLFNDHVRHTVLSNGINLASQRRFRIEDNKIHFNVVIKAGSYEDPLDKSGLAHHLEHILLSREATRALEDCFGSINFYTSSDEIVIHGFVYNKPEDRELLMTTISSILTHDVVDEGYKEKRRILNEIGIDSDSADNVHRCMLSAAFTDGRSVYQILGTKNSVSQINHDDMNHFKKTWFRGPNIFIAITGINNHSELHDEMESRLHMVPGTVGPERFTPKFQAVDNRQNNHGVNQLYFNFTFPVAPMDIRQQAIAAVAENYLDKAIKRKILEDEGIVYHISAFCGTRPNRQNFFTVRGNMLPEDGNKIAPLLAEILAGSIDPASDDEIRMSKADLLDQLEARRNLFPIEFHDAGHINESIGNYGRMVSMRETNELCESIEPEEVKQFLCHAFAQQPAIIAYGDHSKLHSYNEFVQMLAQACATSDTTIEMAPILGAN
jgi:predicted Zn-dependent peptidase